jgi:hypothetical protein
VRPGSSRARWRGSVRRCRASPLVRPELEVVARWGHQRRLARAEATHRSLTCTQAHPTVIMASRRLSRPNNVADSSSRGVPQCLPARRPARTHQYASFLFGSSAPKGPHVAMRDGWKNVWTLGSFLFHAEREGCIVS